MSWNPLSWFTAAKTEFEAIEQKAESVVISLESEALQAVEWFENTLHAGLDELTDLQSRLEHDIADKTEALQAVKDAVAKASSATVAPAPAKEPLPEDVVAAPVPVAQP